MKRNEFLIPANSKKSMLILGFFTQVDLLVFGIGVGLTVILMLTVNVKVVKDVVFVLMPALVVSFLVTPIPYHHNVRTFINNLYTYFASRKTYYWKGWCIRDGEKKID